MFLQELGLDSYNNDLGLKYYDISVGDIRERSNDIFEDNIIKNDFGEKIDSIKGWFMRGVIREDDCWLPGLCDNPLDDPVNAIRPLSHFYDPYLDLPMNTR